MSIDYDAKINEGKTNYFLINYIDDYFEIGFNLKGIS